MNEHDELEELLLKYRKEDGTFKKGYLHSGDGKRILELSIALIPEWKNLEAKLGLKKGSIANLMAYHGISKLRKKGVGKERIRVAVDADDDILISAAFPEIGKRVMELVEGDSRVCGSAKAVVDRILREFDRLIQESGLRKHDISAAIQEEVKKAADSILTKRRGRHAELFSYADHDGEKEPSLQEEERAALDTGITIGLISRIDFGGDGFRKGLLELASTVAEGKGTRFNILVGGLVDKRAQFRAYALYKRELKQSLWWKLIGSASREEELAREYEDFCMMQARELASHIPHVRKPEGGYARLYIVTSPAYDGEIGEHIAKYLAEIRSEDIVYWSNKTDPRQPLMVKFADKTILPVVPQKASWRSRYYSTGPQREIQDLLKRSAENLPDIIAIGCFGASVDRPVGESKRPWLTIPVLHHLNETHSAENQIGIRFLRFEGGSYTITTRSFKGVIRDEREYIPAPERLTRRQLKIFEIVKRAPMRIGMIEYHLRQAGTVYDRGMIKNELSAIQKKGPGIVFNSASDLYDFDPAILQTQIAYPHLDLAQCSVDDIVGFGCLHTGSNSTDYSYFLREAPRLILARRATLFVAAGDLTEGLAHRLLERGEVFAGINNTEQEKAAAHLIGEVISRVFTVRFEESLKQAGGTLEPVAADIVRSSLVDFLWVPGNHDEWQKQSGVSPLEKFEEELIDYICESVESALAAKELHVRNVRGIVRGKIFKDTMKNEIRYVSPISGICMKTVHPGTARTETVTISSERVLAKYDRAHVVFPANWHIAVRVEHYDQSIGQRLALQFPTICTHTHFEDTKIKNTDFGIGFCRIFSKKSKIIEIEAGFHTDRTHALDFQNMDHFNGVLVENGCRPVSIR
ncbi:hypothetical protein L0Y46_03745 [bacterium]|nr:hypothetical protein [bacterium]